MGSEAETTYGPEHPASPESERAYFLTTNWSVVLKAGQKETTLAAAALEQLCRAYWPPLYHYARRRGLPQEDARDIVQSFFASLLSRGALGKADPQRGRFRSFLLKSLNHFLADEWDKATAQKRGSGQVQWINCAAEEDLLNQQLQTTQTPELAYEKRWAIALLEQVYQSLQQEFQLQGKSEQFASLKTALTGSPESASYAESASQLGMTEGAIKVAVHRLRARFRQVLRQKIAETVEGPEELEEELLHLRQVLSS